MLDYPTHTNLPGGKKRIFCSKTKPFLESLPDSILVFPGHGNAGRLVDALHNLENINDKMSWQK